MVFKVLLTSPCIMCRQREKEWQNVGYRNTGAKVWNYTEVSCAHFLMLDHENASISMERLHRSQTVWLIQYMTVHYSSGRNTTQALTTLPISCHFQVRVEAVTSFSILNLDLGCVPHHFQACSIAHQAHRLRLEPLQWHLVKSANYEVWQYTVSITQRNSFTVKKINFPIQSLTVLWVSQAIIMTHRWPSFVYFCKGGEDLIGSKHVARL